MLKITKPIEVIRKYIGSITPSIPILEDYFIVIAKAISPSEAAIPLYKYFI